LPVSPGDVLAGKYRVEHVLGKGGMGLVVAATHLQLEQLVALKFLLPDALKNPDIVGRFTREARAAVKLQSEHVARVSDVGTLEGGSPFMVMEFLEGTDLAKTIDKEGAFDVTRAVDYVLEACEAIAEAHALGIVHRDLKPSNLFLAKRSDKRRIIKVLDFGISKMTGAGDVAEGALTHTTDVLGSPMYMSPEQLRSSRTVDQRTDLWSLGIILFELLTCEVPFKVGTLAEICGAILHEHPKLLRDARMDAPEELEEIVLRCLEKDPNQRYGSVAELAAALEPFGSDAAALSVTQIARFAPPEAGPDLEALRSTALERSGSLPFDSRSTTGSRGRGAVRESSSTRRRAVGATSQGKATSTSWQGKLPERPPPKASIFPWVASALLLLGLAGGAAWRLGLLPPALARALHAPSAASGAPTAAAALTPTSAPKPPPPPVASAAASAAPSATASATASATPSASTEAIPLTALPVASGAPSAAPSAAPSGSASAKPALHGKLPGTTPAPSSTLKAAIDAWGKVPDAPPAPAPAEQPYP
jgi:serine/threonine-protein kinase